VPIREQRLKSKTEQIREALAVGDQLGALRVAARFFDRSHDTWLFKRGMDAHTRAGIERPKGGRCLFIERLIYEQSVARTVREQQEKRSCVGSRQPLEIEQLHCGGSVYRTREHLERHESHGS
jgi:hypothetical protein